MNVDDIVNGYRITTPPTNAGGGMSRWSFAERDGREYFVKMFLAPRYPLPELPGSPEVKARKRAMCEDFERRHLEISGRLEANGDDQANLVVPRDFFRVGATYVKVMDRVHPEVLPPRHELTNQQVLVLLRTLCVNIRVLHREEIVHGDLKPDNVMIQRRGESYIAKLIDYDEAYVVGDPPPTDLLVGDPAFYSPEQLAYVKGGAAADPTSLGLASDMFSLGLLMHMLLVGAPPDFDRERAAYPCEVVLGGEHLVLGPVPEPLRATVERLLSADRSVRPTIEDVLTTLVALDASDLGTTVPTPTPIPTRPTPTPGPATGTAPPRPAPVSGLRSTIGRRRSTEERS